MQRLYRHSHDVIHFFSLPWWLHKDCSWSQKKQKIQNKLICGCVILVDLCLNTLINAVISMLLSGLHTQHTCQHTFTVMHHGFWFSFLTVSNLFSPFHRFNPDLKLSESQLLSVRVAHLPSALRDCVQAIATAAGHRSVASGLSGLSLYLLIDRLALPHVPTYNCRDTLQSLSWHTALARYCSVVKPECAVCEF